MLKEFNLDNNASVLTYIRSELSRGLTLAKFLIKLPFEAGHVITYLPPDFTDEMSIKVEETIVMRPWSTTGRLTETIMDYLLKSNGNYAIFEDNVRQPKFSELENLKHDVCFYNSEVYHWFNGNGFLSAKLIGDAINKTIPAYPRIGVLTSLENDQLWNKQSLTKETLISLGNRADAVIVAAYDDTSHLIWYRE